MTVELTQTGSDQFKGFLIEARSSDDSIIGSFVTVTNYGKYVNCDNKPQTGVTHINNSPKSSVQVKWTAPSDFEGSVKIFATFVQSYSTYWVKVPSNDVEVTKRVETLNNDDVEETMSTSNNIGVVQNNGTQQMICNLFLFFVIIYISTY